MSLKSGSLTPWSTPRTSDEPVDSRIRNSPLDAFCGDSSSVARDQCVARLFEFLLSGNTAPTEWLTVAMKIVRHLRPVPNELHPRSELHWFEITRWVLLVNKDPDQDTDIFREMLEFARIYPSTRRMLRELLLEKLVQDDKTFSRLAPCRELEAFLSMELQRLVKMDPEEIGPYFVRFGEILKKRPFPEFLGEIDVAVQHLLEISNERMLQLPHEIQFVMMHLDSAAQMVNRGVANAPK